MKLRDLVFGRPNWNVPGESGGGAAPAGGEAAPAAQSAAPTAAEILAFDPFGPPSEPAKPAATPAAGDAGSAKPGTTPADGKGGAAAKPVLDANGKPVAPAASPAPAPDPAMTPAPVQAPNLEQLFREQTDAIRSAVAARPAAPAAPTAEAPAAPKFNLGIPPQLIDGLRSDDPKEFALSMNAVVNGIANHLWNTFNQHLESTVQPSYRNMIQEVLQSQQTQAQVAQDFYGKHANLNNPTLRPLIQQAGVEVAQARMAAGKSVAWSEELRDEIAEKIYSVLPALRPAAAGAQPPASPAPGAPKPRFAAGGGAPPAAPSGGDAFGADLLQ